MSKSLVTRLLLPLLLLFVAALLIHTKWQLEGFFLNLAAEVIGILITVSYVEWILRQHERQKWLSTDERIANRLRILLNATVSGLRNGLGFGPDILDERVLATRNLIAVHNEILRVGERVIMPTVHQRVSALDQRGWKSLAAHLANAHNGTLTFLNAFQPRLSPDQLSYLLDLQEALANSMTFYSTFPDVAGVSKDELPETRTPPEILQQHGCESTAKDLEKVLVLVRKLSQTVAPMP